MSLFTSLPQNSEWIVALTGVLFLILVFASLIGFGRKLSHLRKNLEQLTKEVAELRRYEEMRFLKELRPKHKGQQDPEVEAPTLAPGNVSP